MMNPRSTTPRWNVCWYCREASDVKPTIDAARNGSAPNVRRRTPIFHTRRHASPKDGGGSGGSSDAVAPEPAATVPVSDSSS